MSVEILNKTSVVVNFATFLRDGKELSRKSPKTAPEARKSDKNTAHTQQVRFFKLYFDFNVFSAENRRLFSIEFQLHTNSHITLWLLVQTQHTRQLR